MDMLINLKILQISYNLTKIEKNDVKHPLGIPDKLYQTYLDKSFVSTGNNYRVKKFLEKFSILISLEFYAEYNRGGYQQYPEHRFESYPLRLGVHAAYCKRVLNIRNNVFLDTVEQGQDCDCQSEN